MYSVCRCLVKWYLGKPSVTTKIKRPRDAQMRSFGAPYLKKHKTRGYKGHWGCGQGRCQTELFKPWRETLVLPLPLLYMFLLTLLCLHPPVPYFCIYNYVMKFCFSKCNVNLSLYRLNSTMFIDSTSRRAVIAYIVVVPSFVSIYYK